MTKSISRLILLITTFIVLACSQNSDVNYENRTLNYYFDDGKIYSIEEKQSYFNVIIKEIIFCIKAPCIPPIIDTISIRKEEDCKALNLLFEQIFKNSNLKEISIYEDEQLTKDQIDTIFKIFESNNIISKLEYKIINNLDCYNKIYSEKGFSYKMENDSVIYTVAMGRKPSSGYSIDVKKIKIKRNSVIIFIKETSPGKIEGVDDVLTYPIVQIKFNKLPTKITVTNYDTNENYSLVYL